MNDLVVVIVTLALIVLSAFFVVIEFALLGARRHRLEAEAPTSRSARAALRGVNELTMMLAGAQLGITAATFALGAVTKPAVDRWLNTLLDGIPTPAWVIDTSSFVLSLLVVTFLHLVIGEMAPKSWAIAHPERAAKLVSIPGRGFIWLVRPFLIGVNALANKLVAASGVTPVDRAAVGGQDAQTIRQLVEQSAAKGTLAISSQPQIAEALELEKLTVADVMPAGERVDAVRAGATVGQIQQACARSGHKRILVADADGGLPGVVHVRETLTLPLDHQVKALTRPVFTVRADTSAYEALALMREKAVQLAVVVEGESADGAIMTGVVSLSDILRRLLPQGQPQSQH